MSNSLTMPGHVKGGKGNEPDPDPKPYLIVSPDLKREDQNKPYDPKKSYWYPDGRGGYGEGLLVEEQEGDKALVLCGHEVSIISVPSFASIGIIVE